MPTLPENVPARMELNIITSPNFKGVLFHDRMWDGRIVFPVRIAHNDNIIEVVDYSNGKIIHTTATAIHNLPTSSDYAREFVRKIIQKILFKEA